MAARVLGMARRASLRAFSSAGGRACAPAGGSADVGAPPPGDAGEAGGFKAPKKPVIVDREKSRDASERRVSPEFIRPPSRTNPFLFHLQCRDMETRRQVLAIPDFYPGSVIAVTMSDSVSPGRLRRFVGICLKRSGSGLGATFTLRNIIEGQGVELVVELYNPRVHLIEVVRLERRLDDDLSYLRDALPSYSTVPETAEGPPGQTDEGDPVPVNQAVVEMLPHPWSRRWDTERFSHLRGFASPPAPAPPGPPRPPPHLRHGRKLKRLKGGPTARPWRTMDLKAARHSLADREKAAQRKVAEIRAELKVAGLGGAGLGGPGLGGPGKPGQGSE